MSHPVNQSLLETIREMRETVAELETMSYWLYAAGDFGPAQDAYNEMIEAKIELRKLEKLCECILEF